jgi:hypothetical protein
VHACVNVRKVSGFTHLGMQNTARDGTQLREARLFYLSKSLLWGILKARIDSSNILRVVSMLAVPVRQAADSALKVLQDVIILVAVCCPYLADAQIEWTWYPVNQAHAYSPHLLRQHFALWLDDLPMIRAHKFTPPNEDQLPLSRRLCMQQVLVDVGRNDRLGLHVDKVLAAVRLELDGNEVVHVYIPQRFAKNGGTPIKRPPPCIPCSLNVRLVLWKLRRDLAVEPGMRGLGLRDGVEVQIRCRETADVLIAHAFAPPDVFSFVEMDKRERFGRRLQSLELERCASQLFVYHSGRRWRSSPKLDSRLNSSRLRFMKPGARHAVVGRIVELQLSCVRGVPWKSVNVQAGASIARGLYVNEAQ